MGCKIDKSDVLNVFHKSYPKIVLDTLLIETFEICAYQIRIDAVSFTHGDVYIILYAWDKQLILDYMSLDETITHTDNLLVAPNMKWRAFQVCRTEWLTVRVAKFMSW